ncbi:MAG: carboxypeptidase regulatory-like domain-containing protein [Gemmatimonadetes bacterium]|nr:carboxypeptidase regulatory-like domain-containing protein [Gemmatimonadota bacterium]MYB99825.1 carboxypeptidase regulatory-like domain-containing protein [Gemmatimonadota bacterium]MYI46303.1 carboxypeptidase regulatory-like domain-containing protein [Gemmatimonadota bacterium]
MRPFSTALFSVVGITVLLACSAMESVTPRMSTSSIEGVVTDRKTGQPLRDAVVTVDSPGDQVVITNQDGHFILPGLLDGVYAVKAVILGYAPQERRVTVEAGQTAVADFVLEVAPIYLHEIVATGVAGKVWRCRIGRGPEGLEKPVPGL